jgi:thiol-disulfide isomerase/thioredoxin
MKLTEFVKNNIIILNKIKNLKRAKMIVAILILVAISSVIIWNNILNKETDNFKIPESNNTTYHNPIAISPSDVVNQIDNQKGKPVLLYIYTTWCSICKQQLPTINEISRKFQNTDLKVISVAIDKNIDDAALKNYLEYYQNIYFQPQYLVYSDGLGDLLSKKGVKYNKIIPLTVLIDRDGSIKSRFTGYKSAKSLARKIIKTL